MEEEVCQLSAKLKGNHAKERAATTNNLHKSILWEETNREGWAYLSHCNPNKPSEERNHYPPPYKSCRACILKTRTIERCNSSEKGHCGKWYRQSFEHSLHHKLKSKPYLTKTKLGSRISSIKHKMAKIKNKNNKIKYHFSSQFLLVTKLIEPLLCWIHSCVSCHFCKAVFTPHRTRFQLRSSLRNMKKKEQRKKKKPHCRVQKPHKYKQQRLQTRSNEQYLTSPTNVSVERFNLCSCNIWMVFRGK